MNNQYINFPGPLSAINSTKVYIMIYEDQDFERIPLRIALLEEGYAPYDWKCQYNDLTNEGKIGYILLKKLFPTHSIVLLTESANNDD